MTVYESLITKDKQHSVTPPPPPICCNKPCDEPSFWDLLPQCRLNWIAFGLAVLAIGFGLIGLGAINVGNVINLVFPSDQFYDSAILVQGTRLIAILFGIIALSTWIFFKACNDDWSIVPVGALVGASALPLAAVGLIYFSIANAETFRPGFNRTWFNIAISLIVLSIASFLFLAYLLHYSPCHKCIKAKKAIVVSSIFLIGGSAAYSLGRLLWVAIATYQFYATAIPFPPLPPFPTSAFETFILVSIINIVLVVALGWYILDCAVENCYFIFLPLFASAASLGNLALYRVGLNVFSAFIETIIGRLAPLPANTPYIQFAIAIGLVSIAALILTFVIVKCDSNAAALTVASAIPLLYAIATYTYVATAVNLTDIGRYVDDILIGIFKAIGITVAIDFFLKCKATCPISAIIYGFASGSFGWAIVYLYSTYSSNPLDDILEHFNNSTDPETLNTGLNVILGVAAASLLFIRFVACDELLSALTLLNIALLVVGAGGFFGTLAHYVNGSTPTMVPLNPQDVTASKVIYVIFALTAIFLPRFFAKCGNIKRQIIIAVAALSAGIAAVDFGRAVVFSRAVAFDNSISPYIIFSPLVYVASAAGVAFIGQVIVWAMPESNLYTALIASFIGLIASGTSLTVIFFVNGVLSNFFGPVITPTAINFELVGTPWLIFAFALVALLVLLQLKSSCIPQHCRFSIGLLIPALSIAVVGKVAGASAALGAYLNLPFDFPKLLATSAVNSRTILLNLIIPFAAFLVSLKIFCCPTHLAYLPTSIAFTAVVYVVGQFEPFNLNVTPGFTLGLPFFNPLVGIYESFFSGETDPNVISEFVTFVTQTYLVYFLFLAPALIVGFVFACSKQISATVIGTAIAAAAVSLGAVGIANVIYEIVGLFFDSITFADFLEGIQSQFILFAVGVLTALFIYFGKCHYNTC